MVIKKLSLKKNIVWTFFGSIVYSFTQWLLLIVIAKLGTAEMVGQYALALAVTAPIIMFCDLKLRLALVTDMNSSFAFGHYLGTRIVTSGIALILYLFLIFLLGYDFHMVMITLLIGLAKITESIGDIFHAQLQKSERMDYISISNIIRGLITVAVFYFVLLLTDSLIYALLSQVTIWVLVLFGIDCMITRLYVSIKPIFSLKKIKFLIRMTVPLGIMALLNSFNTNIPSYMVEFFLSKEELGYFAALIYISFAVNRLANSLREPAAPRLAQLYSQKNLLGFQRFLAVFMVIGFLIGIVGVICAFFLGEFLLNLIYSPEYGDYIEVFVLLMISMVFSIPAMFLDTGIMAVRYFRIQPYIAGLWVMVSLISCYVFIPAYGLFGAAYAVIIAYATKFFSLLMVLIYALKKQKTIHHRTEIKWSTFKGGLKLDLQEVKQYAKKDYTHSYYLNFQRKVGLFLTWILLKMFPSITANFVTICMLPLYIVSAVLIFLAVVTSNFTLLVISFVISVFTLALDCTDGNIARIKKTSSIKGVYLDRLVHNISDPLFFLFLGFALYVSSDVIIYLVLFILAGILSELSPLDVSQKDVEALFIRQALSNATLNYDYLNHQTTVEKPTSSKEPSKPSAFSKVVKTFITMDAFYITIFIDMLLFENQYYVSSTLAVLFVAGMIYSKSMINKWEQNLNEVLERLSNQRNM